MPLCNAVWGINKRSQRHVHACKAMNSLASLRRGGMVPRAAVLEQKGTGSLGRTGRGHEEGVSSSMSVTSWSVWSSSWGWIRSQLRAYGSGFKAGQGQVMLQWGSATGHPTRKTEEMRPSVGRWEQPHVYKPWSSWGTSTTPISVGGTKQQGISNPGDSWNALMITSFSK